MNRAVSRLDSQPGSQLVQRDPEQAIDSESDHYDEFED